MNMLRDHQRVSALLFYVAVSLAAILGTIAAAILGGRHPDPGWAWLLKCIVVFVLVVGLTSACMRWSGISWQAFGLARGKHAFGSALTGFASGLVLASAWAAIAWFWAPYALGPNPAFSLRGLAMGTLATLLIGVAEEVGYRTYGLDRLEAGFGPATAVLLPSAIFAAMHTTGGMPWLAAVCVVGSCSVLYGTLMLATRSLPLVAAFHIANNLLQDAILRTGDGSLFAPSFDAQVSSAQSTRTWLCMLAINLAIACFVWRKRRRPPDRTSAGVGAV